MSISVFDLFSIGVGPSSSHTVGPMRAARAFAEELDGQGSLARTTRVVTELYGSLSATGVGHGTDRAVVLGLAGHRPEALDPHDARDLVSAVHALRRLDLLGRRRIEFSPSEDIRFLDQRLPAHPNALRFEALDTSGVCLHAQTYYSVGGGFVVTADERGAEAADSGAEPIPYPFRTGGELLAHCAATGRTIAEIMLANERVSRTEAEIRTSLLEIWAVMRECVAAGLATVGHLPGGLGVRRRAPGLSARLSSAGAGDPVGGMDWLTLFALAVSEENAAGGRVVTAPTNGAAGIIPAVLHYYSRFVEGATDDGVVQFLLTAGAIGVIYKETASISGAEVGCQGEVGSACSMAAAGFAAVLGGTPRQVENAAEIGMEHNLGLTCDPIGGLVQIPCIERNALASIKAVAAARTALAGDGEHVVSLDQVVATMRQTGADMASEYKETSTGGLAVNAVEC
ncbi:L-serine ammonia-lyase [Actinokineospora sp. NBRC 105648]|uniref:L-serine ammonia-lyase n=1 Tax=Actinokineospora sp. NBRC 105648 TaxID=3032206 RepID=UPI00255460DA|nr:L-serine ammonia-lyase [Actinokineospora sp. NBRC 105648]